MKRLKKVVLKYKVDIMAFFTKTIREKRLKMILPELENDWKIIDIGCGDGWLTKELTQRGFDCIGIDKIFTNQDICDNDFKNNQFDCSLLIEVIEHIQPKYIKEIERITRKKIIVSTIIPSFDKVLSLWVKLKLYGFISSTPSLSPHIKCYYLDEIPFHHFKLKKSIRYFLVDQFGVYERKNIQ
jgi:2-polyprenyl-3-methyl-5-hydroxy-6-metoxy-1,4-benzoquinol methylase